MSLTIIQRCALAKCGVNIKFDIARKFVSTWLISPEKIVSRHKQLVQLNTPFISTKFIHTKTVNCSKNIKEVSKESQETYSALQLKKRPVKRTKKLTDNENKIATWDIKALATAEEYNLENLIDGRTKYCSI